MLFKTPAYANVACMKLMWPFNACQVTPMPIVAIPFLEFTPKNVCRPSCLKDRQRKICRKSDNLDKSKEKKATVPC